MPYRQTPQNTMEFSGKIADWMRDIQQWYHQEFGANSEVSFFTYLQYMVLIYAGLAKGKWMKANNNSKAKALDSYVIITPNGHYQVDVYATLDFLAENLTSNEKSEWAHHSKTEVLKFLKK